MKLYSRHSEDMTYKYPDVAHVIQRVQKDSNVRARDPPLWLSPVSDPRKLKAAVCLRPRADGRCCHAATWLVPVQGGLVDLVLDAEIVAVDRSQDNRLLPFQTLSTRARHGRAAGACRHRLIDHAAPGSGGGWCHQCDGDDLWSWWCRKDVTVEGVTTPVCVFAFDLLYHNGQPWVQRPFREVGGREGGLC